MIFAIQLHQSCVRYSLEKVQRMFTPHLAVAAAAQYQCGGLNAAENGPDVGAHPIVNRRLEVTWAAAQPLTSGPPFPFGGVAHPTWCREVDHRTRSDCFRVEVDVSRQCRLGHTERVIGCPAESGEGVPQDQ